ncbi:general substrate transporter [Microdochium trichocladiopsis]|uniref:General substrate transporter n=1 Tax=Microdochium trichocladiopsis TaxID=1682393 RepID=A0A9P9BTT5_9PEZI|nr:general substrate transporter [Microdochium trichocladiopsis]KAH7035807.1 general substrate transporter [Microdochium trichocladiopsis]
MAILLITFSQFNFGFDQQGFSASQAMDSFAKQFGDYDPVKKTWALSAVWLSWFNGINYAGQAVGVVLGSWVSNRYGRRMCMFTMSLWAVVCAIIIITSRTREQILVARILNYIYIGMELAVVPVFQSEIAPPQARGFIVGTYQISLMFGGLIANLVARGTDGLPDNQPWMIVLGLFFVVPSIVSALVWFIPESPRWLLMKDRPEEAMSVLRQLREGKFSESEIEAEYATIANALQNTVAQGSFMDIWRGSNLRRTWIVIGANVFLQATGQLFISLYGALFVKSLGTVNPFTITCVIAATNVSTAGLSMLLTDRLGRRTMIHIGATIQVIAVMTMGALGTVTPSTFAIKTGIITTMVIFSFGYSFGWAPTSHTLSAEVPSTRARDMTYRTASVINISIQCAIGTSMPYLLNAPYANLGGRVGFIFGSIAAVSLVFAYFCVPDCAGRSLEELDYLFANNVPAREFRYAKVDLQASAIEEGKLGGKAGVVSAEQHVRDD